MNHLQMLMSCPESMAPVTTFFEKTSLAKLDFLDELYSPDVEFTSPLQQARGLVSLQQALSSQLDRLQPARIEVIEAQGDSHTGFLLWTMACNRGGDVRTIQGLSHFKFNRAGLVSAQQDHWNALFLFQEEHPALYRLARLFSKRVFSL
jgi:hypothetical protein